MWHHLKIALGQFGHTWPNVSSQLRNRVFLQVFWARGSQLCGAPFFCHWVGNCHGLVRNHCRKQTIGQPIGLVHHLWPTRPKNTSLIKVLFFAKHADAKVVTYNLYWWCVSDEYGTCPQYAQGKGFEQIYSRLKENGPFDLIGFQECDNPGPMLFALCGQCCGLGQL